MIGILVDHNLEGHALLLWGVLASEGWLELVPMQLQTLEAAGMPANSSDRAVWRFAQAHGMLLLTDNRNLKGEDSLEQTLREEATATCLPVLTIGSSDRVMQRDYRYRCARRLVDIAMHLNQYRGVGRLFIP